MDPIIDRKAQALVREIHAKFGELWEYLDTEEFVYGHEGANAALDRAMTAWETFEEETGMQDHAASSS